MPYGSEDVGPRGFWRRNLARHVTLCNHYVAKIHHRVSWFYTKKLALPAEYKEVEYMARIFNRDRVGELYYAWYKSRKPSQWEMQVISHDV